MNQPRIDPVPDPFRVSGGAPGPTGTSTPTPAPRPPAARRTALRALGVDGTTRLPMLIMPTRPLVDGIGWTLTRLSPVADDEGSSRDRTSGPRGVDVDLIHLDSLESLERKERLRWAFRLRRRLIIGLVAIYALAVVLGLALPSLMVVGFYLLFFGINEVREWQFRQGRTDDPIGRPTILAETLASTIIVYFSGGVCSFLAPLPVFQVVGVAIHVGYDLASVCAWLGTTAFALLNTLEYFGVLPHSPLLLGAGITIQQVAPGLTLGGSTFRYLVLSTVSFGFLQSLSAYCSGYVSSKLKVREDMLERSHQIQSSLYHISSALLGQLSVKGATSALMEWLVEEMGFARVCIELDRGADGPVRHVYPRESMTDTDIDYQLLMRPRTKDTEFLAGYQYLTLRTSEATLGWLLLASERALAPAERAVVDTALNHYKTVLLKARDHEEVHAMSITDGMTGVNNHRHFIECLKGEVKRSRRYRQPLALVLVDVDHFKRINDVYGHLNGDTVLRGISQRLKAAVREMDIVARYGGEEFAVLAVQTDRTNAALLAERLRKRVDETPFDLDGVPVPVSISIGVSEVLQDEIASEEDLIRKADTRLYKAKESGRNRVVID